MVLNNLGKLYGRIRPLVLYHDPQAFAPANTLSGKPYQLTCKSHSELLAPGYDFVS